MKNIFLLLLFPTVLFSQVNFSEDVSPIIYNNCTECHRDGGAGPMPFTSYEDVAALGFMVQYVTQSGYMPPWHADPDYSHFIGERVLTDEEKQLITDWVQAGMPQGDPALEASIPEFPEGSVIGTPDAVFTMEEEYLIEGNNQDDYRVFVFSTNFTEDKYLKSIEIIPGNLSAVHHVLVNIDTEGACAALDASTPEYGYECESGFCVGNIPQLSAGYTPGMVPPIWNNDIGLVLPAGADLAIQVHYAPSSIDEYDQSSVNLFFKDQPVEREVEVLTIVDTQLEIPANEIYTHYYSYEIPFDMSIISVLPHMHLIGESWLIYAENDGDTIPIISIPDWDFNWQTFYQPEYMLKLPEGYTLHAYATYDNTSSNPSNPNSPPQDMFWCDYTTCEMFFLPFAYVEYQEGDENIYLGDENDIGCMDELACNYNSQAIIDDDSCNYTCIGCMDVFGCNYDPTATIPSDCDYESCQGCLSEEACNFCSECTIPSDCDYSCYGCMDTQACNYDSTATIDLGCDYSCIGCTNPLECNYNPNATIDDGNCGVLDDCGVCHTLCCYNLDTQICDYNVSQEDCVDYWPTIEEVASDLNPYWNDCILGCTNPFASNYNPDATIDDGSCVAIIYGCTDMTACNYNPDANANGPCYFSGSACPLVVGADCCCCGPCDCLCNQDIDYPFSCEGLLNFDDPFSSNIVIMNGGVLDENCNCIGLVGCTDDGNQIWSPFPGVAACNFDPLATAQAFNNSCEYPTQYYDCDGNCINDINGNNICDETEDCLYNEISIVFTGIDAGIAWSIAQSNGWAIISGGLENVSEFCIQDDCWVFNMYDADGNGDGWSDVNYTIYYTENNNIISSGTLDDGNACSIDIQIGDSVSCEETYGCLDPNACNYNCSATDDDNSCAYAQDYYNCNNECLNDIDNDGVCDELECLTVFCWEFYECVLGECVCINDMDDDGICDELESECLEIEVLSINQINPDQLSVTVENNSSDNIFAYPGFILFNEFGDTIAIENVEYYGIAQSSIHILDIQENIEITDYVSLELHTWYYDYLTCVWNDVIISDNCDLVPDPGFCFADIDIYYFNPTIGECEVSLWGGCGGVVPFWTLEECQNSCQSILIPEIETNKAVIKKIDILGRDLLLDQGIIINLHNDGSVEKELILEE